MSIIKKSSFPLHLDVFNVFINDTNSTSRYFKITQLQDTLTGGKNAFLIQGSLELREGSYLFIEVKDSTGQIIYSEPAGGNPSDYYEGVAKPVSIHVYDDTLFGPATITIVGELKEWDDNGIIRPIPDEWIGKINVKWQKTINVNPFLENTTPIRLYRRPKIDIQETLLDIFERQNNQNIYTGYFRGVAIDPPANTDYPYNGPVRYEIVSINPTSASFISNPPTLPTSQPAVAFNKKSIGIPISVNEIYSTDGVKFTNSGSYTPVITNLISPYRAIVDVPFVSLRTANDREQIKNIALGSFTTAFESSTIIPSDLSSSYARMSIKDLETFSGDIYRLKVFAKSRNDLKGFFLLEDIVLENNELLETDFFDVEGQINKKTGEFTINDVITDFWVSSSLDGSGSATLSTTDNLLNSVLLEPFNEIEGSQGIFKFYNKDVISFTKNTEYILNYTPLFSQNTNFSNKGLLDVYVSGTAFNNTITEIPYGKKISTLSGTEFQRYERQSINFKADNDGSGSVAFVVRNGNWELSDISLKAAAQTAFNPSELSFLTKPNIQIPSESFDFRFELFDINYTYVPIKLEKTIRFGGGNDILPGIRFTFFTSGSTPETQFSLSDTPVSGTLTVPSNAFFTVSPNGITGSPAGIAITGTLNLIQLPITFDSSSGTAYDLKGNEITLADVETGFQYPGKLDIEAGTNDLLGSGPVRAVLQWQNFKSKLKGGKNVGYIEYKAYQSSNSNIPNPTPTFTIAADWSTFLGCTPVTITSINTRPGSFTPLAGYTNFYITASGLIPAVDDQDKAILWIRPSGSANWHWGGPYPSVPPVPFSYISGSPITPSTPGLTGDKPWLAVTSSIGSPIGGYTTVADSRDYRYIDFRFAKKCYNNIIIDDATDFFRYESAPYLDAYFRNGTNIVSAPLISPPPATTVPGYNLASGPNSQPFQWALFRFEAGNFVNENGELQIYLEDGGTDPFEMAISGSGIINWDSDGSLRIPWTDYGSGIINSLFVRLKGGAPVVGNITSNLVFYPQSEAAPSSQVIPLQSTVVAGATLVIYLKKGRGTGANFTLNVNGTFVDNFIDSVNNPTEPQSLIYQIGIPVGTSTSINWLKNLTSVIPGNRAWHAVYHWSLCSPGGISAGNNDPNGINTADTRCSVLNSSRLDSYQINPTVIGDVITLSIIIDDPTCGECYATPLFFGSPNPTCVGFPSPNNPFYNQIVAC
jgi:hypothetical protein